MTSPPASPTTDPRSHGPLSLIGPRTLACVGLLVALELLLHHVGGYGWWTVTERSERYGWRMLPDQTGWSRDHTVPEVINSHGFRDREWAEPAPGEELLRVAVVGNSMTYGTSVPIEQTWPRVLEDALREEILRRGDPREVIVMNFAVQGYVFEQMARVWDDHIRPWEPDLFLVPTHPHDVVPLGPTADDAGYDFRTTVLRTATYDYLHKRVMDRWLPPVPVSPKARAEARAQAELDADVGERPFAREHAELWARMVSGRPAEHDADGALVRPAMTGLLQMAEQLDAWGGRLVLVSLPRWRQAFEPDLISTANRWEAIARRDPRVVAVDPMPAFRAPMAEVVAQISAMGDRAWQTEDMGNVTWTDERGVERRGDEIPAAGDALWFLDDVGHYNVAGHALLGRQVFEALRDAGAF